MKKYFFISIRNNFWEILLYKKSIKVFKPWCFNQRRERDSNPRYVAAQWFSRPPHSTTLPSLQNNWAGNETQTRDPQLGRLMLYQLSYSRRNMFKDWTFSIWLWGEQDSNLRRRSQRSYSPPQLATLVSPQMLLILIESAAKVEEIS